MFMNKKRNWIIGIILGFITMGWQTTSVDNIDWEGFGFTLSVYIMAFSINICNVPH